MGKSALPLVENRLCYKKEILWFDAIDIRCGVTAEVAEQLVEHAPGILPDEPKATKIAGPFECELFTHGRVSLPMFLTEAKHGEMVWVDLDWLRGILPLLRQALTKIRLRPERAFSLSGGPNGIEEGPPRSFSESHFQRP